jgi:MFS family permease
LKPLRVTFLLCTVEVLGLAGLATFPSLLPFFKQNWALSNTQAGWLSAIYYGAYVVCVPVLTARTDRQDAKKILLCSLFIGTAAALGFSMAASGFWSALFWRFWAGVSLAGIYMPGLKLLSDHTEGPHQSRYISFYTASFSLGTSLSYFLAGEMHRLFGWRWAFAGAGLLTLAGCMMMFWLPSGNVSSQTHLRHKRSPLKVVFRNPRSMAYILAYTAHMWELFSMRSWMVAFLTHSRHIQTNGAFVLSPTQVVALINLIGLPASIGGNELCRRLGRKRVIKVIMSASACISAVLGFCAPLPYAWVVCLGMIYGILVLGDSASLTAGAVAGAAAHNRGATLAVHSTLGFGAAFLGPLTAGVAMDLAGGHTQMAWGLAFITMGIGGVLGTLPLSRKQSIRVF